MSIVVNTNVESHSNVSEEKKLLREKIRAKRRGLPDKIRTRLSEKIMARLSCEPIFKTDEITFLYASMPEEVQLYGLIKFMLDIGRKVAIPFITKNKEMFATELLSISDLTFGDYGILIVKEEKRRIISPESIGLIIAPGVAFTERGDRLGMGGGYYDKFFYYNKPPAKRVALAFDLQIVEHIPTTETDEKVDFIVTESRSISVNRLKG